MMYLMTSPNIALTESQGSVITFLRNNIWFPVLIGILVLLGLGLLVYCFCRWRLRRRYDYTALEEDMDMPNKVEMEKRQEEEQLRDTALLNCSFYLRSSGMYTLLDHLPQMGNRSCKHWFLVRDLRDKNDKLLTMMPRGTTGILAFTSHTKHMLNDLVQHIKHPLLFPIQEVDFSIDERHAVIVQSYNSQGSLKDLLYSSQCSEHYQNKYYFQNKGLPLNQVQRYGRCILEALLFLKDKGFPPFRHLHSGNVMIDNNMCRLAGYENVFLGYDHPYKLHTLLWRKLQSNIDGIESLCFGHLVYEMCTGSELDSAHPEPHHLADIADLETAHILNFIFENSRGTYPTLKQIRKHRFFSYAILDEDLVKVEKVHLPKNVKTLLRAVRKGKPLKRYKTKLGVEEEMTEFKSRPRLGTRSSIASIDSFESQRTLSSLDSADSPHKARLASVADDDDEQDTNSAIIDWDRVKLSAKFVKDPRPESKQKKVVSPPPRREPYDATVLESSTEQMALFEEVKRSTTSRAKHNTWTDIL